MDSVRFIRNDVGSVPVNRPDCNDGASGHQSRAYHISIFVHLVISAICGERTPVACKHALDTTRCWDRLYECDTREWRVQEYRHKHGQGIS